MKARVVALAAPLLATLALAASARDDEKDKPKAAVYKTPEEVFDAFVPAMNKRDTKTYVGCLAPAALKRMAGQLARLGVQRRVFAESGGKDGGPNDKLMKSWKETFEVLDKHGLKSEVTRKIKAADQDKAEAALSALVKDHAAFVLDYLEAVDRQEGGKLKEGNVKAKLSDVKIDGDSATGTVTYGDKDAESKQTFGFVKVGEGWKLAPSPRPDADKDKKAEKSKDK